MSKYIYIGISIIAFLWILLLVTNSRILLNEIKIEPREYYFVEGWDNVGDASQASLVCTYFNGSKILKNVLWYSPNNIFGRDSCPFVDRE
ncbi:hypothetical protein CO051_04910 [Candidatus Roizmanbacteria bacterium CG_4_9_14_0_2_um_filter_39_13]|uniref:Uncharacterized protein n=2 Tax=Candidatus Roizmaniibacteriota TaxID=1752723 RepID=A0A2M8EXL9_9BACT|nr:MAG: hypothetical protein CO051_04910 [Candidatus Roizmanbacteria bacterium CG_4_9_14_0_2_um_filter_39_13]PJE62019.1 MAG: hypothetical protein COU87_01570 [Candidatus Roizmanbacteria bacterium CG10_big_fil_rev_8_21_14_0_10_39_12]